MNEYKIKPLSFALIGAFLVLGTGCPEPAAMKAPFALAKEGSGFVTNLTKLARANDSSTSKMPAYIPALAHSEALAKETRSILNAFKRNEESGGKRNNMVLIGERGVDIDARAQSLAFCIAKECSEIPDDFRSRDVITLDMKLMVDEAKANLLADGVYMAALKTALKDILDKGGKNAIFFLNDFSSLNTERNYSNPINIETVLKLFLEHEASIIIEATPDEFNKYFANKENAQRIYHLNLDPLPSAALVPALEVYAGVEAKAAGLSIEKPVVEDIVRLTRAFLPFQGTLAHSTLLLGRVLDDAARAHDLKATREMAVDALSYFVPDLQKEAIASSSALSSTTTLDSLDAHVALQKDYYTKPHEQTDIAGAAKAALAPALDDLKKSISGLHNKIGAIEQALLATIDAKARVLSDKIASLGDNLSALEVRLAQQLVKQSTELARMLATLDTDKDAEKLEALNALLKAQSQALSRVEYQVGQLNVEQRDTIAQLASTREHLAQSIASVDSKAHQASTKALAALAKLETQVADGLTRAHADFSRTNSNLSALAATIHTLSANESETYNALIEIQSQIAKRILPKLSRLSRAQAQGFAHVQAGLNQLSGNLKSESAQLARKMTTNYLELLNIIDDAKKDAVAQAANTLSVATAQIYKDLNTVDAKVDGVRAELLKRLADDNQALLATLTNAINTAKSDAIFEAVDKIADARAQLSADISKVNAKTDAVTLKLENAKTELFKQLIDNSKALSETLTKAVLEKTEAIAQAAAKVATLDARLSEEIAKLTARTDGLSLKLEADKADLFKQLADNSKDLTDTLNKTISTAKSEAISEAVGKIADARAQLSADISKVNTDANALSLKFEDTKAELFKQLTDNTKALSETLTKAIGESKADAIADAAGKVAALDARLSGDISKLNARSNSLSLNLEEAKTDLFKQIAANSKALTETLTKAIGESKADAIAEAAGKVAMLNAKLSEDISQLNERTDALSLKLEADKTDLLQQTAEHCKALGDTLNKAIKDSKAAAIAEAIKQVAASSTQIIADMGKSDAVLDEKLALLKSDLLKKLFEGQRESDSILTKAIEAAHGDAIAQAVKSIAETKSQLSIQISNTRTGVADLRTELLSAFAKDLRALETSLTHTINTGHLELSSKVIAVSHALKEAVESLSKYASMAHVDSLKAAFETQMNDLLGLLFDTAGIIAFREQQDFGREVKILPNCSQIIIDLETLNPKQIIVECGTSCLIVDERFWMKEDEAGDRFAEQSFEIRVGMPGTDYISTIRCVQRKK